jgi:hypothetical protein
MLQRVVWYTFIDISEKRVDQADAYWRFGGTTYIHLQNSLEMKVASSSETSISHILQDSKRRRRYNLKSQLGLSIWDLSVIAEISLTWICPLRRW